MEKYYENETIEDVSIGDVFIKGRKYVDCKFKNCKFMGTQLDLVSFTSCSFVKCDILSIQTENSEIKNCSFKECNLIGVNWKSLSETRSLRPFSKFTDNFLKYNSFMMMNLNKIDFSNNEMIECHFDDCQLKASDFRNVKFDKTVFTFNNLEKANFKNAVGYHIDITNNKIKGAKFSYPEVFGLLEALQIEVD